MTNPVRFGRIVLFLSLDTNTAFVEITLIPTIIFAKNAYHYSLEFKWLTFSFQIEYTR